MTTKHFTTVAFAMGSGALGGILSGALLATTLSIIFIIAAITQGEWQTLVAVPAFAIFGAMYGLVGGLATGLIGGAILAARGQISEAPMLGKRLGRLVGAVVAAAFPLGGALPVSNSADLWQLALVIPAAIVGGLIGQFGGQLAGNLLIKLMAHDPIDAPSVLKHSSQSNN